MPRHHRQAGDMVGMLVGDQDGAEVREILADGRQALSQLAQAQAGIDQDARIFRRQQGGVARTAASQHAESNDSSLPRDLSAGAGEFAANLKNTPKWAKTEHPQNVCPLPFLPSPAES
jgi:hypothetical protein